MIDRVQASRVPESSRPVVVGAASQSMSVAVASYMLSVEGYPYVSGLCQSVRKSVCPVIE